VRRCGCWSCSPNARRVTGNQEIVNLPHEGLVPQDTGSAIFDAAGALLFFAGGRKHSELPQGEEIFCDILA
jgi:hypothetical protein